MGPGAWQMLRWLRAALSAALLCVVPGAALTAARFDAEAQPHALHGGEHVPAPRGNETLLSKPKDEAKVLEAQARIIREVEAMHSLNSTASSAALHGGHGRAAASNSPRPRVFFLFLTIAGLNRMDIWNAFFANQDPGLYRAFIHCKESHVCGTSLATWNPFGMSQVSTVQSSYCTDLVSPMVHLLSSAMLESATPADKFVFVSESTLPTKPFNVVYHTLMVNQESDFCVYPKDHWIQLKLKVGFNALIVKHSQWVVLNQAHARAMVERWPSVKADQVSRPWKVPAWSSTRQSPYGKVAAPPTLALPMCIDEWDIFATAYGALLDKGQYQEVMPSFSNGPLHLQNPNRAEQGTCWTFAFWDRTQASPFRRLIDEVFSDSRTHISCYPNCQSFHPAEFVTISDHSVSVLRKSPFLFARKFSQQALTLQQFQKFILV